jgi:hypothetical protein
MPKNPKSATENSGKTVDPKKRGRVENLTPFKPGQTGNPGGRPKKTRLTDAYRALLEDALPEAMEIKLFGDVEIPTDNLSDAGT